MNKLTKIGLNAMVVFTMMFATTVVVAQEKAAVLTEKAEVEFVGFKTFANTLQMANSGATIPYAVSLGALGEASNVLSDAWYQYTGPSATDPNPNVDYEEEVLKPENYINIGATNSAGCVSGSTICAIKLTDNGSEPDENDLEDHRTEILSNTPGSDIAFQNL